MHTPAQGIDSKTIRPSRPHAAPLILLAGFVALSTACAPDSPAAGFAIENVTVIDAANGVRANQTVVVRGDTIVSVADAGAAAQVAEVVDGAGRYLIPGLWDMHVHLTYDDDLTPAMPGLFLRWGVTSIRDTGGLLHEVLPMVRAMRAEGALAPRVFFAGPLLDGARVVYDGDGRPEIGVPNRGVEAARANVAALVEAGVDFIKIYEMVTPEVFDALAADAARRGLPIAAHVPLAMRAREVAPRVHSMEHLRNVEMDCAIGADRLLATRRAVLSEDPEEPGSALRSRLHSLQRLPAVAAVDPAECDQVLAAMTHTIQVPTLRLNAFSLRPPYARDDWFEAIEAAPEPIAASWRATGEARRAAPPVADTVFAAWSLRLVGDMYRRGIPIGAGTDTPINFSLPGYALHSELEMLVRAGLPPLEAIRSATIRPAEFFGLQAEMGSIAPGMRADLVLLGADPLADISNTRRIEAVVAGGRLLRANDSPVPGR